MNIIVLMTIIKICYILTGQVKIGSTHFTFRNALIFHGVDSAR